MRRKKAWPKRFAKKAPAKAACEEGFRAKKTPAKKAWPRRLRQVVREEEGSGEEGACEEGSGEALHRSRHRQPRPRLRGALPPRRPQPPKKSPFDAVPRRPTGSRCFRTSRLRQPGQAAAGRGGVPGPRAGTRRCAVRRGVRGGRLGRGRTRRPSPVGCSANHTIEEIDAALERITMGTYGICEFRSADPQGTAPGDLLGPPEGRVQDQSLQLGQCPRSNRPERQWATLREPSLTAGLILVGTVFAVLALDQPIHGGRYASSAPPPRRRAG